jgi:hydrogenase nickel incorporation protein HypA/HybF
MHELTVAKSIVDIAEREVERHGASKVAAINLEIGMLAGIEFEAFDFAWPEATRGTVLDKVTCNIKKIEGRSRCTACGAEFDMKEYFDLCPECHSFENELVNGHELRIKSLELVFSDD